MAKKPTKAAVTATKATPTVKPSRATLTNPWKWDRNHGDYLLGQAVVDGVDLVATEMEDYWGIDRLRLLVDDELRGKFDRQRYLLQAAILYGDLAELRRECARMINAWKVLNHHAIQAGHSRLPIEVLEVAIRGGRVAAIVREGFSASRVIADGRHKLVYTLAEIGELLGHYQDVVEAKLVFPGAEVTAVRRSIEDPLKKIDQPTGLADQFDDSMNDELPETL